MYGLGGITLVSEIELPELPLVQRSSAKPHPVHIRLGEVPNHLPQAVEIDPDCFATPTYYWLRIHGIGCYLVTNGEEIIVSPEVGVRPLDVRAYLLGTLFVALCQQRHLLPLHASAVSSSKGAVAFLARSGEGKSSLAAYLSQRGFSVLADDVCLIDCASSGPAIVIPTAPWLKLWRKFTRASRKAGAGAGTRVQRGRQIPSSACPIPCIPSPSDGWFSSRPIPIRVRQLRCKSFPRSRRFRC